MNRCRDQQLNHGDRPWLFVSVCSCLCLYQRCLKRTACGSQPRYVFSFPWVNRPYTESRMWPEIRRLYLIPMHVPTIQNFPCFDPSTLHKQNSVFDCPTPYRIFSFFDKLYIKNSFFEAHNMLKISDSFTHLPYERFLSLCRIDCTKHFLSLTYLHCTNFAPTWAHLLYTHKISPFFFRSPFHTQSLTLLGHVSYVRKVTCMFGPIPCSISATLRALSCTKIAPRGRRPSGLTTTVRQHPEMGFRVVWLQFTTVSRKPTASTSRIKEYSEEGGSMFFETCPSLYQATLLRITGDSNLQKISHFGKTCVRKISSFQHVRR